MDVMNTCLCCLLRPSDMNLKASCTRDGSETYSDMMESCFAIQLTILGNQDNCGICEECVGRLRDASDFKLQVQRSQVELRAQLGRSPCVKNEEVQVKLESIQEPWTGNEEFEIEIKTEIANDGASEDPLEQYSVSCPVTESPSASTFDREAMLVPYTCNVCGKQYRWKNSFIKHTQEHDNKNYPYNNHSEVLSSKVSDEQKMSRERKKKLDVHIRIVKGVRRYQCDVCEKKFTQKISLISHLGKHMQWKPYSCDICHKQFYHQSALKRHKRLHTGEHYSCEMCNKQFTQRADLTRHRGNRVCQKNNFIKHNRKKYTRPKIERAKTYVQSTYTCDYCSKICKKKSHLVEHLRMHTGEKPFRCDECGKRFAHKQGLTGHKRVHSGDKPFACETCGRRFTRRDYLTEHVRTHTGSRPFTCGICYSSFSERATYSRHVQRKHNEKNQASDGDIR